MSHRSWKSCIAGATAVAAALFAAAPLHAEVEASSAVIGDFGLIDHRGVNQQLSRLGPDKAVVILSQANACTDNIEQLPRYKLLRTMWADKGIEFLMLNASPEDDRESVNRTASIYDIDFPIMLDESQLVAENLGLTKAGEVAVVDPTSRRLLYRGPLQAPRVERARGAPRTAPPPDPLVELLTKVAAGTPPAGTISLEATGCPLTFPVKATHAKQAPDYAKDVVPILKNKCTHCHVEGGIAPFAMNSYDIVRGFSPMIREVLMTRRMPPAQVDPHVSRFQNASYMSNEELQTLVHWIDSGAPRGSGKADPLTSVKAAKSDWQLGKPDYVVELPAFEVPATGVIDYFNHTIELPFASEDKYVRAVQFIPGDRRVLHHILGFVVAPTADRNEVVNEEDSRDFLEGFAPGKDDATQFPKDAGVFIPKGHNLRFAMHYTSIGKSITDKTRVGLYFYDKPPANKYLTYSINGFGGSNLVIPPGAANHKMNGTHVFDQDITLHALRPHMHYRGKAFRFTVVYPDQRREVVMNVPNYDFGWQRTYRLTEPLFLPKGSRIITDGVFDNSKYNPGNPDPSTPAVGGPQTWNEMFIGYVTYTVPGKPKQITAAAGN